MNLNSYTQRAQHCQTSIAKQLLTLLDAKQTNLAISADVTRSDALLNLAEILGPEICVFKTHIDIIEDFTPETSAQLERIAAKHHFFIFEDRKFADIGNTVKHQYAGGIYHIADWAHIVNAHTLPGPGIIQGLAQVGKDKERGLLLLAEMSSQGHLMDANYQATTVELAEANADFVIGFICQHALPANKEFIHFTPGIQLDLGHDALGQKYNTPESAILEKGSDIIIVGRGIIQAPNPLAAAKIYRQRGYAAYRERIGK